MGETARAASRIADQVTFADGGFLDHDRAGQVHVVAVVATNNVAGRSARPVMSELHERIGISGIDPGNLDDTIGYGEDRRPIRRPDIEPAMEIVPVTLRDERARPKHRVQCLVGVIGVAPAIEGAAVRFDPTGGRIFGDSSTQRPRQILIELGHSRRTRGHDCRIAGAGAVVVDHR